jgi:Family of unknown function (DUF5989)
VSDPDDFRRGAADKERGLIAEFLGFLRETRTWWLAPILIVFLLLGVLLVLGATGVAPFLYPLVG